MIHRLIVAGLMAACDVALVMIIVIELTTPGFAVCPLAYILQWR